MVCQHLVGLLTEYLELVFLYFVSIVENAAVLPAIRGGLINCVDPVEFVLGDVTLEHNSRKHVGRNLKEQADSHLEVTVDRQIVIPALLQLNANAIVLGLFLEHLHHCGICSESIFGLNTVKFNGLLFNYSGMADCGARN